MSDPLWIVRNIAEELRYISTREAVHTQALRLMELIEDGRDWDTGEAANSGPADNSGRARSP